MLYWYTGQPGHGKTMHALERVMDMKQSADKKHVEKPAEFPERRLFIVNVREADYQAIGGEPLSPEEFKTWANSPEYVQALEELESRIKSERLDRETVKQLREELESQEFATAQINPKFENAIILIDEAYEHGIFPKRAPGAKIPRHVERMAKHRHFGMDVVCVSQSSTKQCDEFLHDLVEEQVHVRRMFMTGIVRLKIFDKAEGRPDKATPISIKRQKLLRKSKGLYKSTMMDTSERRIPWYFWAFGVLLIAVPLGAVYNWNHLMDRFHGRSNDDDAKRIEAGEGRGNGARSATVAKAAPPLRERDLIAWLTPRVKGQPWTAPAYDRLEVPREPPRVFCMSSGHMKGDHWMSEQCTCLTEQGTRYYMEHSQCSTVAQHGQYEPFLVTREAVHGEKSGEQQYQQWRDQRATGTSSAYASAPAYGADGLGAY